MTAAAPGGTKAWRRGVNGDFDPTEYIYTASTGLLEKVRHHSGQSYYDAEYFYDGSGKLARIEDRPGGNGLRYGYDALGRIETLITRGRVTSRSLSAMTTQRLTGGVSDESDGSDGWKYFLRVWVQAYPPAASRTVPVTNLFCSGLRRP